MLPWIRQLFKLGKKLWETFSYNAFDTVDDNLAVFGSSGFFLGFSLCIKNSKIRVIYLIIKQITRIFASMKNAIGAINLPMAKKKNNERTTY